MLWLEVTNRCNLACVHCYADASAAGTHGTLSTAQWQRVITDAASCGVRHVTFIGGEPTLRADLPALIAHATASGLTTEVFSNLTFVPDRLWACFQANQVSIATSYYSPDPGQHKTITGRDTLARTRDNIARALRLGLDVRIGLIGILEDQQATEARAELIALGVQPSRIGYDRLRQVGRGIRDPGAGNTPDQLCGRCARGVAAISGDGDVWPCVFARWQPLGSILAESMPTVLGEPLAAARRALYGPGQVTPVARDACSPQDPCNPNDTPPDTCGPDIGCKP